MDLKHNLGVHLSSSERAASGFDRFFLVAYIEVLRARLSRMLS